MIGWCALLASPQGVVAHHPFQRFIRAHGVINAQSGARIVPEIELRKIAVKVLLIALLIDTPHPALERVEEAFNGVRGYVAASIFLLEMHNPLMSGELLADSPLHAAFVGMEAAFTVHILAHEFGNVLNVSLLGIEGSNLGAQRSPSLTVTQLSE